MHQAYALAHGLPLLKWGQVSQDVQAQVENILAQLQNGQGVPADALEGLASSFMF